MRRRVRVAARGGASLALLLAPVLPAGAVPVIRGSVGVSGSVGYSTNPFLFVDNGTDDEGSLGSGLVDFSIRPSMTLSEQNGEGYLGVFYHRAQYFRRYSESEDYGANAGATLRLSPLLTLTGGASFTSSILGAANVGGLPVGGFPGPIVGTPGAPGTPGVDPVTGAPVVPPVGPITGPIVDPITGPIVDPITGDIGLIGLRQRRNLLGANLGATLTPSERDVWTANFFAQRSRYPGLDLGQDYDSIGGSLGYSRAINGELTLGLRGSANKANYQESLQNGGDTTVFSPELTFGLRLEGGWTIDGSAGASFTSRDRLDGSKDKSTALSGSLAACRRRELGTACLTGSRAANPTGFGGVQQTTTISASYSRRIDELTGGSAQVGYTRTGGFEDDLLGTRFGAQEYLSVGASVDRRISERLSATASLTYRDSYTGSFQPKADVAGLVGVAYSFNAF